MSIASDETADRVRDALGNRPGLTEKRMFGGICFMLNGNMLCGTMSSGALFVRVGLDAYEAVLERPGAMPMMSGARVMEGYVAVPQDMVEDEDDMAEWLALAQSFVRALPPKEPKPKRRSSRHHDGG